MPASRAAVLGSPIAHSLSPVLHRAAYRELALDWTYDLVECDAAALPRTLARLGATHRGLSLTMPLKHAVLPHLDELDPLAAAVGAVNTVLLDGACSRGHNTDVAGLAAALAETGGRVEGVAAVVLGGGATAAATLAALAEAGVRAPTVVVRATSRADALLAAAARLGVVPSLTNWPGLDALADADLAVSTVPVGAADGLADQIRWRPGAALVDVGYAPWPTRLAAGAHSAGVRVVGGLAVLVGQAAAALTLMTGRPAPAAVMRGAGEAALAARSAQT